MLASAPAPLARSRSSARGPSCRLQPMGAENTEVSTEVNPGPHSEHIHPKGLGPLRAQPRKSKIETEQDTKKREPVPSAGDETWP